MNDQSQVMNQKPLQQPQPQPQMMTQQPLHPPPPIPSQIAHHPQMMMNQPPIMTQHSYGMWPPPARPLNYPNPMNPPPQGGFVGSKPRNWNGKKGNNKGITLAGSGSGSNSGGGYRPPALNELQHQNRVKARRFFNPKKKFNNRFAPYAPRNTTSFLIRAKKSGGIASLVSPCPVTPAVLPTPIFSPSREILGDMAKEEWGVDGYGSMKGLIRLRSPGGDHEGEDEEDGGSSSDSDVEEHVEVERRLDHDLSRFEMIYPNYGGVDYNNVLENRVDDQDSHIAQLEEENLILKERLFLMEREMDDLRRRMQYLERRNHGADEINEEVVDNVSENDSESRDNGHLMDGHNEENREEGEEIDGNEHRSYENDSGSRDYARDVCMDNFADKMDKDVSENKPKDEVSTVNQYNNDVSTENNPKDYVSSENQYNDDVFTTENKPKDDVCMDDFADENRKDVGENQSKDEVSTENQCKDDVSAEKKPKDDDVFIVSQSKDVQEGTCSIEKISETNNDIVMENVQAGVDAVKD